MKMITVEPPGMFVQPRQLMVYDFNRFHVKKSLRARLRGELYDGDFEIATNPSSIEAGLDEPVITDRPAVIHPVPLPKWAHPESTYGSVILLEDHLLLESVSLQYFEPTHTLIFF